MTTHPNRSKKTCRPREHLAMAGKMYPAAWRMIDRFRADRGTGGLPNWPEWCFLPLAGFYAIVSADAGLDCLPPHLVGDVGRLAGVGTWRYTQGIYRFDPALYPAIAATPVDGNLPCDVLYRLPEWCVYVETPNQEWFGERLHGFFAHLEWDANDGRIELRLLLDCEEDLTPLPLHLGDWPLLEAIRRALTVARVQALGLGLSGRIPDGVTEEIGASLEPLVSLLLYLCSQNAEVGDGTRSPQNPAPKRTKQGWRLFAADKPTAWDVGARIGAALRRAYHAAETGQAQTDESGRAMPRAHIRRAHWHGFWTGPKNTPEERKLALHWLPPIPVNVDDTELPATVRPVK